MNRADMFREIVGTCDGGDCDRHAVSLAYERKHGLIPVCRRHILTYRVNLRASDEPWLVAPWFRRPVWQCEDEWAALPYCRRASFRWLAQRRILRDQRAAAKGRLSRAQRRLSRFGKEMGW